MHIDQMLHTQLALVAAKAYDATPSLDQSAADLRVALKMADRMADHISAYFKAADVLEHIEGLQRIVVALPMEAAIKVMHALAQTCPGCLTQMPALAGRLEFLTRFAQLADTFRLERLTLLNGSTYQSAESEMPHA